MAVSVASRRIVRERAAGLCEYCHAIERWQFVRFTIDHVLPVSRGGTDDLSNLALACRNCNERRGNRCEAGDSETGAITPLFDPRTQLWAEHFLWSTDRLRVLGITATGRATVALLDFNDDRHEGIVLKIRQRDRDDGQGPPVTDPVQQSNT